MKFPISKQDSIITLEVKFTGVAGVRRLNMVLDTGSTFIMAPWEAIESLGYDPAGSKKKVVITTASTVEKAPVVNIKSVSIGDLVVENPEIVVHNLPPGSRIEGLLGLDFLKSFTTLIDYKNKVLEIKTP